MTSAKLITPAGAAERGRVDLKATSFWREQRGPNAMIAKLAENQMDHMTVQALNLDEQVAHLLRRAHQRASSLFLSLLGEHQLTPTQFFAMARLHERGQLSQNRLGRLAAMDPATIQGVIRRLEERGYIQRNPDANDRRRMVLTLTSSGTSLVDQLLGHAEGVSEAILEPLSTDERDLFVGLLKRLT